MLGTRYRCSRRPSPPAANSQKILPRHVIFTFFCSVITWQLFIIVLLDFVSLWPSSLAVEKSPLLFGYCRQWQRTQQWKLKWQRISHAIKFEKNAQASEFENTAKLEAQSVWRVPIWLEAIAPYFIFTSNKKKEAQIPGKEHKSLSNAHNWVYSITVLLA